MDCKRASLKECVRSLRKIRAGEVLQHLECCIADARFYSEFLAEKSDERLSAFLFLLDEAENRLEADNGGVAA